MTNEQVAKSVSETMSVLRAAKRLKRAAPELLSVLAELLEETNPFITDANSCECGEYGTGWSEDEGEGGPCIHIRAVRAINAATGK